MLLTGLNFSSKYTATLSFHKVFFIIPCVDIFEKIDMRTATYEIPPQEVGFNHFFLRMMMMMITMMIEVRTATHEIPPQEVTGRALNSNLCNIASNVRLKAVSLKILTRRASIRYLYPIYIF